jgi:dolichol-phosphate mannosyltransferase
MPTSQAKTLVFVPTYEERDNVRPMLAEITRAAPHSDVLFIDDSSPDGTGQILDELAKGEPRLKVIHRAGKLGIGGAHQDGIAYAYDHGYEVLVTLDCDFTHTPADIPDLLRTLGTANADIAVGSRFLEADSLLGWHVIRKLLTNVGHLLTVNMLGIKGDATGAFRVYNLKTIPREMFGLIKARGYAFFFESLFVSVQNGLHIAEHPIRLPARAAGRSKMTLIEIQRSIRQLGRLLILNQTNPGQFRLNRSR